MLAATKLLWCVQMAIQATLISKALHKIPRHVRHCLGLFNHINMCQLSIVLLFLNVAGWIGDTFYAEPTDPENSIYSCNSTLVIDEVRVNLSSSHAWSLIRISTGPFIVFVIFILSQLFTAYMDYTGTDHGGESSSC